MKIFIVAGEESSDLHAANLIRELTVLRPEIQMYGLGGERMKQAGAHLLCDLVEHAVIGFWEVIKNYSFFNKVMHDSVSWIKENHPDAIILVDYPGFNLRLAQRIHFLHIPIIYYISPQVWAWGKKRIPQIAKLISLMLLILPFETETYAGTFLKTEFIGHPLLDVIKIYKSRETMCFENKLDNHSPIITLLPGSRLQEIRNHLPVMLESGVRIRKEIPSAQFILLLVHNNYRSLVENLIARSHLPVTIVTHEKYDWRAASDLSLVASGTATLEGAIIGTPMIIVYQVAFLTYFFAQWMIRLPYIGLANLVAGKKVVPELVQYDLTPDNLAKQALELLNNKQLLADTRIELMKAKEKLGEPGASRRAAQAILDFLKLP